MPINGLLILPSCNIFKYGIKGLFVFHSYFNEIFSSFALQKKQNRIGYPPILKSYGEINYCQCIFEKHHLYHHSSNFKTILYIPNFLFFFFSHVCTFVCIYKCPILCMYVYLLCVCLLHVHLYYFQIDITVYLFIYICNRSAE